VSWLPKQAPEAERNSTQPEYTVRLRKADEPCNASHRWAKQTSIKTNEKQEFYRGRVHQAKRCQADKSRLYLTSRSAEVTQHMSPAGEEQAWWTDTRIWKLQAKAAASACHEVGADTNDASHMEWQRAATEADQMQAMKLMKRAMM